MEEEGGFFVVAGGKWERPGVPQQHRSHLQIQRKRKNSQAMKATPHINSGKGAILVPSTVKLLHRKKEGKNNGDLEGCRLGLKPAPDES
jgi:hypothetical protein